MPDHLGACERPPLVLTPDELAGATVRLGVGDVLVMAVEGDPLEWRVRISATCVLAVQAGARAHGAVFRPGLEALAAGRVDVELLEGPTVVARFGVVVQDTSLPH